MISSLAQKIWKQLEDMVLPRHPMHDRAETSRHMPPCAHMTAETSRHMPIVGNCPVLFLKLWMSMVARSQEQLRQEHVKPVALSVPQAGPQLAESHSSCQNPCPLSVGQPLASLQAAKSRGRI